MKSHVIICSKLDEHGLEAKLNNYTNIVEIIPVKLRGDLDAIIVIEGDVPDTKDDNILLKEVYCGHQTISGLPDDYTFGSEDGFTYPDKKFEKDGLSPEDPKFGNSIAGIQANPLDADELVRKAMDNSSKASVALDYDSKVKTVSESELEASLDKDDVSAPMVAKFYPICHLDGSEYNQLLFDVPTTEYEKIVKTDIWEANKSVIVYDIVLPTRSSKYSAGYDFHAPCNLILKAHSSITVPTFVKAKIKHDWVLMAFPRSGLGFKYEVHLANTVGVIDSDYFYSKDCGGHIWVKLVNPSDLDIEFKPGDKMFQGIFMPYGITVDDDATGVRTGGFGSSDKK